MPTNPNPLRPLRNSAPLRLPWVALLRLNRPALVISLIPLALLPCCWLWWWAGGLNPTVQPGRSAALLLVLGSLAAAWAIVRTSLTPRGALPLLLALAWQALALSTWDQVPEPGLIWFCERAAGLACAVGLAIWLNGREITAPVVATAIVGLGILILATVTMYRDLGSAWKLGSHAPFGNVNFNVGAAMPLVAIGIAMCLRSGRWWVLFAAGASAVVYLLGTTTLSEDRCNAVWLATGAAIATALILRLPARFHCPLLILGGATLVIGWILVIAGVINLNSLGHGIAQRVYIGRAASEALVSPMVAVGYGPAAAIAVLPEQASFASSWLTVPSYLEHAHNEPLQVLLDGGLVLAGLLVWALVWTIRPLWLRRHEALPAALLVAWCTAGAQCLIESHLSQPGSVLCLALLAGLSWSVAPFVTTPRKAGCLPIIPACGLTLLIVSELAFSGGGPTGIEARVWNRIGKQTDISAQLHELDRLRLRLGPLSELDYERAKRLCQLKRFDEANAALASHLNRLPVDVKALRLAETMRTHHQATPKLAAAEIRARARAQDILNSMKANARNQSDLTQLKEYLNQRPAGDGPALAQ